MKNLYDNLQTKENTKFVWQNNRPRNNNDHLPPLVVKKDNTNVINPLPLLKEIKAKEKYYNKYKEEKLKVLIAHLDKNENKEKDEIFLELYEKYLKKYKNKVGFFEVDGNEVQFVDRTKNMGSRIDWNNDNIKISENELLEFSKKDFVQFVNEKIRHQSPKYDDSEQYWDWMEKNKNPWDAFFYFNKYKDQPYAKDILLKATKKDPSEVFYYFYKYKDQPYAKEILLIAAEKDPSEVFEYFYKYKDQPYAKEILLIAAEKDPWKTFRYFNEYKDQPYAEEILAMIKKKENLLKAAKKDPWQAFAYFNEYKNQPYAEEILAMSKKKENLLKAAKKDPSEVFYYFNEYKDQPYAKEILLIAVEKDPWRAFSYFNKYKDQPYSKEILLIAAEKDPWRAFEYFNKYKNQPYAKEILDIASESFSKKPSLNFLNIVQITNDLHNESEEIRFSIINKFSPSQIYKCIIKGRAEIFTSSYNGIMNQMFAKMKKSQTSLFKVFRDNNFEDISIFLEASSSYNRSAELLNLLNEQELKQTLSHLIENISADNFQNVIAMVEFMMKTPNPEIIEFLENKIKEKLKTSADKIIWNLIAHTRKEKSNDSFFAEIDDKYKLPDLSKFSVDKLFKNKVNHQQYYFYNDKDGQQSYQNMLNHYKKDKSWKIEYKDSYVIISKTHNGKSSELYVNKPDKDENGIEKINEIFREKNISAQIVVHRGHSYHAEKTINNLKTDAQLVFLGSCGGFQNVSITLEKSPKSHIISTKGTGTMHVNDPLFKIINDEIFTKNNTIAWGSIWEKAGKQLEKNKNWKNYIRPDENFGALFIKKYEELN